MSKHANSGELRTKVFFKNVERNTDAEGFPKEVEINIFGKDEHSKDIPARVKWVNVHGTEVFSAMQLKLRETATITMRYSPKINAGLLVYKGDDPKPYEIISVDNVEERSKWLEIKVQRKVAAR